MSPTTLYYGLLLLLAAGLSMSWYPLAVLVQVYDLRPGWRGSLLWSALSVAVAAWLYAWGLDRIRRLRDAAPAAPGGTEP